MLHALTRRLSPSRGWTRPLAEEVAALARARRARAG